MAKKGDRIQVKLKSTESPHLYYTMKNKKKRYRKTGVKKIRPSDSQTYAIQRKKITPSESGILVKKKLQGQVLCCPLSLRFLEIFCFFRNSFLFLYIFYDRLDIFFISAYNLQK